MAQAWDVSFERLGRRGAISFTVRANNEGEPLARAIVREASKHLISKGIDFEITPDEDGTWTGYVAVGFHAFPFTARKAS